MADQSSSFVDASNADLFFAALFGTLAMAAEDHMHSFNAQDVASTAWAFAEAGAHAGRVHEDLFYSLRCVAEARVGEFNDQGFANTA